MTHTEQTEAMVRLTTEQQCKLFGSDLIDLLRREARHGGIWFADKLLQAADELEARAQSSTPPVEQEAMVEHIDRLIAGWNGESDLKVGPHMLAQGLIEARAAIAAASLPDSVSGEFIAGPVSFVNVDPDEEYWQAEIQIVGGHFVAAEIYATDEAEAKARQRAVLNALNASPDSVKIAREALVAMLRHSCVADSAPEDKDAEDHDAERKARQALAALGDTSND